MADQMTDLTQNFDGMNVVFIHSAIDDAGLDPFTFRILMHLCRRANRKSMAWPSLKSMAATTGISQSRIQKSIDTLQARRMLTVTQAPGTGNRHQYELTSAAEWILTATPETRSGSKNHFGQSDTTNHFKVVSETTSFTREGNPREGNPDPPTPTGAGGDFQAASPEFQKIPKPPSGKGRDHEGAHHYPPDYQASMAFCEALADYFMVRREKRQAATVTAATLLRNKLIAFGLDNATRALQTSAANGWTGVFPEAPAGGKRKGQTGQDEPDQELW